MECPARRQEYVGLERLYVLRMLHVDHRGAPAQHPYEVSKIRILLSTLMRYHKVRVVDVEHDQSRFFPFLPFR